VPCSFIAPAPGSAARMEVTEKHSVVSIVPVHVSSNQSARTMEQILASKKQTHVAAFRYALQELQRDLSHTANELGLVRYVSEFYKEHGGKNYTPEGLVKNIMTECHQIFKEHDQVKADDFAKDETFRRLVTVMLDVKTMAKSKLRLWLEDSGQCIRNLEDVSLHDAHQQLLGFLRKRMQHGDAQERRASVIDICKLRGLLDQGVDDMHGMKQWETRLISAAADGISSNDLELLLEAGSVRSQRAGQELTSSGASDNTGQEQQLTLNQALMKSAEFGHLHCIKVLVESRADMHFRGADGETPLCMAAQNGHAEAVRMLLDASANVNAADKHGLTPLFMASRNGFLEATRVLLQARVDVNAAENDGTTPLYMAAQNGHADAVRMLLEASADVNAARKDGVTPLYVAAWQGHAEAVRMLLEASADVNATGYNGDTPLHLAACYGHAEAVRMLLEASADVNAANNNGVTPLYRAAQRGHAKAVSRLLEARADVNAADNDGVTPLHVADREGHVDIGRILAAARSTS
jgi:ankyrin repeat protein